MSEKKQEKEQKLLVRVDLFGEGDSNDAWTGYIYGLTRQEFWDLFRGYEHDGMNDIFVTWMDYLEKNKITYEPLSFDIDMF